MMRLQERVEFRLDSGTKRLLEELAHSRGQSLGEVIREILQKELGDLAQPIQDKHQAARELVSLKVGSLPCPEELEEEISRAFGEA